MIAKLRRLSISFKGARKLSIVNGLLPSVSLISEWRTDWTGNLVIIRNEIEFLIRNTLIQNNISEVWFTRPIILSQVGDYTSSNGFLRWRLTRILERGPIP